MNPPLAITVSVWPRAAVEDEEAVVERSPSTFVNAADNKPVNRNSPIILTESSISS